MKAIILSLICVLHCTVYADERLEQKAFFQENGYLWIKNFFSPEQVQLLQNWIEDTNTAAQALLKLTHDLGNLPAETLVVVPEAGNPLQVCRAEDLCTSYPDFYHFVMGTINSYIGYLLDEPYVLFKDKINFKWPGGGAFLPHQDFPAYEYFGPREHVTAMVCIDPATLENGCLQIAQNWREGSTILPYITGGKAHGSIQPEYSANISWLPLETSPGDLVLFNSYIPHYSEVNKSKNPRRALFLTHNRLREGNHRKAYYHAKRHDPLNPAFHFATPTHARDK